MAQSRSESGSGGSDPQPESFKTVEIDDPVEHDGDGDEEVVGTRRGRSGRERSARDAAGRHGEPEVGDQGPRARGSRSRAAAPTGEPDPEAGDLEASDAHDDVGVEVGADIPFDWQNDDHMVTRPGPPPADDADGDIGDIGDGDVGDAGEVRDDGATAAAPADERAERPERPETNGDPRPATPAASPSPSPLPSGRGAKFVVGAPPAVPAAPAAADDDEVQPTVVAAVDTPVGRRLPPKPSISVVPLRDGGPIVIDRGIPDFEPLPALAQPYRPDTVVDGFSNDHLTVRAASLRGYSHRYKGVTRQDDMAVVVDDAGGRVVLAVADGVSSASKSHLGATLVCRFVTDWLLRLEPDAEVDWAQLVESAAWALVEYGGANLGTKDAADVERILATTLVAGVVWFPPAEGGPANRPSASPWSTAGAEPEGEVGGRRKREREADPGLRVEIVQVGDSSAWVLGAGGFERLVGGKEGSDDDDGVWSSMVSGLPRLPTHLDPIRTRLQPGEVLLLGTDGFGDPLGKGTGLVGELFAEHLQSDEGPPSQLQFAHLLDFSRETFDDDRTLVAVWRRPWITSSPR